MIICKKCEKVCTICDGECQSKGIEVAVTPGIVSCDLCKIDIGKDNGESIYCLDDEKNNTTLVD